MTSESLQKILSENIKRARKSRTFSQEKLAEAASMSIQMINDIEGCRRWPSEKSLTKIANALDVEVYTLFEPKKDISQIAFSDKKSIVFEIQKVIERSLNSYLEEQ